MSSRSDSQARQGPGTENRQAKQDVNPGSKPVKPSGGCYPRGGGRWRESGQSSAPKPRKPRGGVRGAAMGKRPQPRGEWRDGPDRTWQDRGPMMEDGENEVGSIFNAGSKKQSLNHLLNFQYAPRGNNRQQEGDSRRRGRGNYNNNRGTHRRNNVARPRYKKEHYLQANCQFIVKASGDYSIHANDPDILVNWDLIEQVHLKTSGSTPNSCPICLYPPTAAKISRCGHVFCWACILHYLALSDDSWRKCPICYESIQKVDLKSVVSMPQVDYGIGAEIEMFLMKRERNSLFSVPVLEREMVSEFPVLSEENSGRAFVKLLLASPMEVTRTVLARERAELEKQFKEEKDQPEVCFIQEALQLLALREREALGEPFINDSSQGGVFEGPLEDAMPPIEVLKISNSFGHVDPFAEDNDLPNLDDMIELSENAVDVENGGDVPLTERHRHNSSSSDASSGVEELSGEAIHTIITAEDLDISGIQQRGEPKTGKREPKATFYFYQSSDGQPIFLHALNVQMLVEEHGSLEACPPVIKAAILEKDSAMMTEDLRDRLRYLRHLPVASSFEVAELELLPPIVSKKTMEKFREQLMTRKRKRAKRNRDERRREKRIQAEEQRKLGFRGPMVRIESSFETKKSAKAESLVGVDDPPLGGEDRERHVSRESDSSGAASVNQENSNTPSFAKMLRDGGARPAPTPVTRPTEGVLGAMVPLVPRRQWRQSDSEPEPEEWVPPPPTASLGDTLAAALQNAEVSSNVGKEGKGKKKGKRGKQILLTTSARPMP